MNSDVIHHLKIYKQQNILRKTIFFLSLWISSLLNTPNFGTTHVQIFMTNQSLWSVYQLFLCMFSFILQFSYGPDSVVGIATGYRLDGPGIESQWGAIFSPPVQTGPEAHPDSCTMGTGSFPAINSGRVVKLTLHPLLAPWSWKGRAILLLPLWAVGPVQSLSTCTRVRFTFFYLTVQLIGKQFLAVRTNSPRR